MNGRRFGGSRGGFRGRGSSYGGGFGGSRDDDSPKPVNVGEEYDVEISEVGSRGDGIARVKNFVVFVSNVKQGDKVKIKIKEVRNRFAIGEKVGEAEAGAAPAEEAKAEGPKEAELGEAEPEAEAEVEVEAEAEEEVAEESDEGSEQTTE